MGREAGVGQEVVWGGRRAWGRRRRGLTKLVDCSLSFLAFHASSLRLFSANDKLAAPSSS